MRESLQSLELDKILTAVSTYAVTEGGRAKVLSVLPTDSLQEAKARLDCTAEAAELLFTLGAGQIEYFPPLGESLERAEKGAVLSCKELKDIALLLRSARLCYRSVRSFQTDRIVCIREITEPLIFNERLEEEIDGKIIGDGLSDHASERLFQIRREIRLLGERIRARLSEYLVSEKKYLQDDVVTMRGDRFVLPVKVEYKRSVKGFVHDRSASGATVFIEPEEALEMNNELCNLRIDEKEEEEHILAELSHAAGAMKEALCRDVEILSDVDCFYARAEYGYRLKCVKPQLGADGVVDIVKGRHPLLDQKTAVPVTVSVGQKNRILLISGANTGGKTVTLKMCGLFCLMAACGLFVPAERARFSVFGGVFCDVGDSQSIEENLSTFSSHILNIKQILDEADEKSFVLIDEPGGGTDPEEGQALAQAIVNSLLMRGCRAIVTTHFSALKEFAYREAGIENGCMEFDAESLRPLYRLRIGAPGSSNALLICSRLGVQEEIISDARARLGEGAQAFEFTVRAAEESRIRAEEERARAETLSREWESRLAAFEKEREKFLKEKERFQASSKAEARRIVLSRTAQAEEILAEIEEIFQKESYTEADLIRARTLKNKIGLSEEEEETPCPDVPVQAETLKAGDKVYLPDMETDGIVLSVKRDKKTAQVQCGALKVDVKLSDLYLPKKQRTNEPSVRVVKNLAERPALSRECNVIGMTAAEAVLEIEAFLDGAVVQNLEEVRIVHGMGTGKLRAAVHEFLRRHKHVKEFRLGKYGEGESGVTVVTLK